MKNTAHSLIELFFNSREFDEKPFLALVDNSLQSWCVKSRLVDIPLKWLEDSPNIINDNNRFTSESKDTQGLIPTTQSSNNQINMGINDFLRRISMRNKKVPITMSKDFLWDSQVIRN
jgi:hypothetical protein